MKLEVRVEGERVRVRVIVSRCVSGLGGWVLAWARMSE